MYFPVHVNSYCNFISVSVLPVVSSENATIIIDENDNARGSFSFSSTTFTAPEGSSNSITLSRTGGTYGEV